MKAGTLKISWRNIGRNKKRTALALLAIGVGQFALLAANGIMRGYSDNIRLAIKKGVRVGASDNVPAFHELMETTGQRDQFGILGPEPIPEIERGGH